MYIHSNLLLIFSKSASENCLKDADLRASRECLLLKNVPEDDLTTVADTGLFEVLPVGVEGLLVDFGGITSPFPGPMLVPFPPPL